MIGWVSLALSGRVGQAQPRDVGHGRAFQQQAHVFLGGLIGMPSLADPKATAALRRTGVAAPYIHWYSTEDRFSGGKLPAVAATFTAPPESMAELNIFDAGFFTGDWVTHIRRNGFSPSVVTVNTDGTDHVPPLPAERVVNFKRFVDEGRAAGLKVVAPFITPNSTISVAHPFADPWWDRPREMALYGGGVAFDAPPAYFLVQRPPGEIAAYQLFIADALAWAHSHQLYTIMVMSPRFDRGRFQEDAQAMYRELLRRAALPDAWVVENYDLGSPPSASAPLGFPSFGTPMAPDSNPETQAGVALWFAGHARIWNAARP